MAALIATLALFQASSGCLSLGLLVVGLGGAFVQQFRFAAADNAPPEFKARAISFVLAGGVFTAIIGPQIVIFTHELLAPVMFAGSFVAIIVLAAVGACILSFLPAQAEARPADTRRRGRRGRSPKSSAQPRFFVGAAVRRRLLRADELRHDRRAARHGRLRLLADEATLGIPGM